MLGASMFNGMMSEIGGIILSSDNITQENRLKKDHGIAESNGTRILQCPPYFDSILCWSRTDASKTATLPCPPASIMASIMGYTDLASDNLAAMASKVCLANGTWYRDSYNVSWSNYSLCILNSTRDMIEGAEKLNYPRWYEIPPEESLLLNVSCVYLFSAFNID
jgi:hypothetical protein